jgi:hypothetical protein
MVRVVHENPFSDRINDYVQERGFTLWQLHDTITHIIQTQSLDVIKTFITIENNIIAVDTDKVIEVMEKRYGN